MCVILALSDPECPVCSCVLKQVLDWVARICLHFHVSISAVNEPGAHIICNILKEVQLSHGNVSCSLVIHQVQDLDGSTDKIYIFPNKTSDTQRSFITRKWKQHLCCFLLYVLWTMGLPLVKTKELQGGRQEEADGFLKRDYAIYFLRSYLRLYDFLEGNFLPLTIRVIIVSWGKLLKY